MIRILAIMTQAFIPQAALPRFDPQISAKAAIISGLAYKGLAPELPDRAAHFGSLFDEFNSLHQRVIVIADKQDIWVAFEGSNLGEREDYLLNLQHSRIQHPLGGRVHEGFMQRMRECITDGPHPYRSPIPMIDALHQRILELHHYFPEARLHLVGHSAGGASAMLQAAHLAQHAPSLAMRSELITFGQPRVGNKQFCDALQDHYGPRYNRFVLPYDYITELPPTYGKGYTHGGIEHRLPQIATPFAPSSDQRPPHHGIMEKLVDIWQCYHGIRGYRDACLAPLGITGQQFAQQLSGNTYQDAGPEAGSLFGDDARAYLRHFIDIAGFYRQDIKGAADIRTYDAAVDSLHALHRRWLSDTPENMRQFGQIAHRIHPIIRRHQAEGNGLDAFRNFLLDVEQGTLLQTPFQQKLHMFIRTLDGVDGAQLPPVTANSLKGYHERLQEILDEQLRYPNIAPGRRSAEGVGHIMRHIANMLRPELPKHPDFTAIARRAEEFHDELLFESPTHGRG